MPFRPHQNLFNHWFYHRFKRFTQNNLHYQNIRKYLLAVLFNATSTMNGYYQAEVNHDLPQYAS